AQRDLAFMDAMQSFQGKTLDDLVVCITRATGLSWSLNELRQTVTRVSNLTSLISAEARHLQRFKLPVSSTPHAAPVSSTFPKKPFLATVFALLVVAAAAGIGRAEPMDK